jgi:surface protein
MQFNQPLAEWDVGAVTSMKCMFNYCYQFNQPLNAWNTSAVQTMQNLFTKAVQFNQPLDRWNVSSVQNMHELFSEAHAFNQPLATWRIHPRCIITRMLEVDIFCNLLPTFHHHNTRVSDIFGEDARSLLCIHADAHGAGIDDVDLFLEVVPRILSDLYLPARTELCLWEMARDQLHANALWALLRPEVLRRSILAFVGGDDWVPTTPLRGRMPQPHPRIRVNNATIRQYIDTWKQSIQFQNHRYVWAPPSRVEFQLADLDVSEVTDFVGLFAETFLPVDVWKYPENNIGRWQLNTRAPIRMDNMFQYCLTAPPQIAQWDVSRVISMEGMFHDNDLMNIPLNHWNVSNVTAMGGLFRGCRSFNQPLDQWNVGRVRDMNAMFMHCASFDQPLNTWNVSQVTNMWSMFQEAKVFNQPLDRWDVSQVTEMSWLFCDAFAFNQPLDRWILSARPVTYRMLATPAFQNTLPQFVRMPATVLELFHETCPWIIQFQHYQRSNLVRPPRTRMDQSMSGLLALLPHFLRRATLPAWIDLRMWDREDARVAGNDLWAVMKIESLRRSILALVGGIGW